MRKSNIKLTVTFNYKEGWGSVVYHFPDGDKEVVFKHDSWPDSVYATMFRNVIPFGGTILQKQVWKDGTEFSVLIELECTSYKEVENA